MLKFSVILLFLVVIFYARICGAQKNLDTIDYKMVQQITKKIGDELLSLGESITSSNDLHEKFAQAKVVNKSGSRLAEEIAKDLKSMMDIRINAVKRIVKTAEELPKTSNEPKSFFENYEFVNSRERDKHGKTIKYEKEKADESLENLSSQPGHVKWKPPSHGMAICYSENQDYAKSTEQNCLSKFDESIDLEVNEASVFFPLDVYDNDGNITQIVHRTKGLDKAFITNYKQDPSIGWQFFCNSSGLFRHYPATQWDFYPINMFDCRMRNWFTGTASSAKDIIILIEKSGSMTGNRIGIATDVVRNILDTLTFNDFVNVFKFSDTIENLIDCYDGLVQATSSNIFEFKQALNNIETENQTDLAEALKKSFEVLEDHRQDGANCNQAIMLITDGMEYNETIQDLFKQYNWNKKYPVRIFSFLIGTQIPEQDYEQVKLMACENKGYYVQIDTKSETREQVLKYIPVMARPMVLHGTTNPITWSTVYADMMDPYRITNYDWNCKQRAAQRHRMINFLSHYGSTYPCIEPEEDEEDEENFRKYMLVTTVAMPAYEKGGNSSKLMGVAGIDVPLFEFERLLQQFQLGVGGYAFIVDHNGNIVTHPDFRPFFQHETIKPSFNSLDMLEVELMDDEREARDFNPSFLNVREAIIKQTTGSKFMIAKQHYDDMRRILRMRRNYFWTKIGQTPFTVVVAFPDHYATRVQVPEAVIEPLFVKGTNLAKYFNNFRIHPEWIYCRSTPKPFAEMKLGGTDPDEIRATPEEELVEFLQKLERVGWKWKSEKNDPKPFKCDRKLMQSLIFDATVIEGFPQQVSKKSKDLIAKFDVKLSFISTHSGLLRYETFDKKFNIEKFANTNNRAINEAWYKHAVEFNYNDPQSFIFSVPFDAFERQDPLVTVAHTIHVQDELGKAPVAVAGFQFSQSKLQKVMQENCKGQKCYILDDNAYIISGTHASQIGKFFGTIENELMHILVEDKIYKSIDIYDYQAVCYLEKNVDYEKLLPIRSSSSKVILKNPFLYFLRGLKVLFLLMWNLPRTFSLYMDNLMYPDPAFYFNPDDYKSDYCLVKNETSFNLCLEDHFRSIGRPRIPFYISENEQDESYYHECLHLQEKAFNQCKHERWSEYALRRHINRTMPNKCDKFSRVYLLNRDESNFEKPFDVCDRPYVVQKINHTNLILLITNQKCDQVLATRYEFYERPTTVFNGSEIFCQKHRYKPLFRRHSKLCFSHHDNEPINDRKTCGFGNRIKINILILIFTLFILKTTN